MIVSTIFHAHARYALNTQLLSRTHSRAMMAAAAQTKRAAKQEGTIADVFTTLNPGAEVAVLPARFAQLKKDVLADMGATHASIVQAWKQVLADLEGRTKEIVNLGGQVYAPVQVLLFMTDTGRKIGYSSCVIHRHRTRLVQHSEG
jgi:hypothetical protein